MLMIFSSCADDIALISETKPKISLINTMKETLKSNRLDEKDTPGTGKKKRFKLAYNEELFILSCRTQMSTLSRAVK